MRWRLLNPTNLSYPFRLFSSLNSHEIEKKFEVNEMILKLCQKNSHDVKIKQMIDIYYDSDKYLLSKQDMWLRYRNNVFELKWPSSRNMISGNDTKDDISTDIDHYLESTDVNMIRNIISTSSSHSSIYKENNNNQDNFNQWLNAVNLQPFCKIKTIRYRHSCRFLFSETLIPLFVDIDFVSFNDDNGTVTSSASIEEIFKVYMSSDKSYVVGEIEIGECSLDKLSKFGSPVDIMKNACKLFMINPKPIRGKVLEYLFRYSPTHYQALRDCGQLGSKGI